MAEGIREAYMQPRAVREALEGEFSAEVILEVFYAVDDYAMYWDIHRTGDGFDTSYLSLEARVAFKMVQKVLTEYNSNYWARSFANQQNALAGAEQRREREEKNRLRRERYAAKKLLEAQEEAKKQEEFVDKSPEIAKNGSIRHDEKQKNFGDEKTKSMTTFGGEQEEIRSSSESEQSLTGLLVTVTNSEELITVVTEERGCGGKRFIHSEIEDKSGSSVPTSGLSGSNSRDCGKKGKSKPLPASPKTGEESKAVRGSKGQDEPSAHLGGSKAVKGSKEVRKREVRNGDEGSAAVNSKFSAKTVPVRGWPHETERVLIDESFKVDFFDPTFVPYAQAPDFLINGFETWVRKELIGRMVEKKWLAKKFWDFACNQGLADFFIKRWEKVV
ncbi:MAG: hypothetical protein PHE89_02720 [Alphaproteobacteria bacterium]|nr:hypothetical protein [Alphaproteobacteria bacterium]